MPARKKSGSLCQRIQELINQLGPRENQTQGSQESEQCAGEQRARKQRAAKHRAKDQNCDQVHGQRPAQTAHNQSDEWPVDSLNLGMDGNRMIVSLESFIELNFEISRDLERLVERKILDAHQREWDEWADLSSTRQGQTGGRDLRPEAWSGFDDSFQADFGQADFDQDQTLNQTYPNRPK